VPPHLLNGVQPKAGILPMSDENLSVPAQVDEISKNRLAQVGDQSPFSAQAIALLNSEITSYCEQLIADAIKSARRISSDIVSAADVRRAAEHLSVSSRRTIFRRIGDAGITVLGVGLSTIQLAYVVFENHASITGLLILGASVAVGASFIVLRFTHD
jgi:histone H3/H4